MAMTPAPQPSDADSFSLRAALFYVSLLIVTGIQVPFFPLWLEAKALEPTAVAIVVAAPMLVRVIAAPLVTRAADRIGAFRGTLVCISAASTLIYVAIAGINSALMILLSVSVAAFFFTPIGSLADAYTIKGAEQRGVTYGRVRLWGSVAFVLANLGGGLLLHLVAAGDLIWLIVAALALMSLAALALRPLDLATQPADDGAVTAGSFKWTTSFVCVVLGASLVQASHAIFYSFSAVHWTNIGFDGITVGALWALGVSAEVVLFAFAGRIFGAVQPVVLIAFGAAGALTRWIGMAFDPPIVLLAALQLLHALSFGATHLGSVQFVARAASHSSAASAQGYFAMIQSSLGGIVTMTSGILYAQTGEHSYLFMAALAAFGGLLVLVRTQSR